MRRFSQVIALSVLAVVLAGCSSVKLDREVSIGDMSVMVPSDWVEESDENDYGTFSSETKTFTAADDSGSIYMSRSSAYDTPEESLEGMRDTSIDLGADSYDWEMKSEEVIDGARCQIYEVTEGYESGDMVHEEAIIDAQDSLYTIIVYSDDLALQQIVDTVSF